MKYKILHTPKTGGTALKSVLVDGYISHGDMARKLNVRDLPCNIPNLYFCDHHGQLNNDAMYIGVLRDPIERFISHVIYQQKHGDGYDTDNTYNPAKPLWAQYNNLEDIVFNIEQINLAEGNVDKSFKYGYKSIQNIDTNRDNLFYIMRMEHLNDDFIEFQNKLGVSNPKPLKGKYNNIRPKKFDNLTKISDKAKLHLRYYYNDDYEIINYLCNEGFVSKSYLEEINYYEHKFNIK